MQTGEGMAISLGVKPNRSQAAAQWHKDGEVIVDTDAIHGTVTQTLVFDSVRASDGGVYCCRVSDGDESVTSAAKTVELVPSKPIVLAQVSPAQMWVSAGRQMLAR